MARLLKCTSDRARKPSRHGIPGSRVGAPICPSVLAAMGQDVIASATTTQCRVAAPRHAICAASGEDGYRARSGTSTTSAIAGALYLVDHANRRLRDIRSGLGYTRH